MTIWMPAGAAARTASIAPVTRACKSACDSPHEALSILSFPPTESHAWVYPEPYCGENASVALQLDPPTQSVRASAHSDAVLLLTPRLTT